MIKDVESEYNLFENLEMNQEVLLNTMREASKKIAPVWPLENFVAVNPFLGFTSKKFSNVAQELAMAGAVQMTLPASFYLDKLNAGEIIERDIEQALSKRGESISTEKFIKILKKKNESKEVTKTIATVADLATEVTKKDWERFLIGRVSQWAASYFDKGQAIWVASDQKQDLFYSWKTEAQIDRTPELIGLKGFRKLVKSLPDDPIKATKVALDILGVSPEQASLYFHRLLLKVGGWAAYAARLDWDSELYGGKDGKVIEFLALLICWEACLLESLNEEEIYIKWDDAKGTFSLLNNQPELNQHLAHNLILQEAFDLAAQRKIIEKFELAVPSKSQKSEQAKAQAIFCIDVRSEVFRRNLELVDHEIETLGFAGFFAFPIKYVPIGHNEGEAQCPVLLKTGPTILEELSDPKAYQRALSGRLQNRQVQQVWKSFKSGAVTCFSFVSPMGLSYLPKIFTDSFGLTRPVPHPDQEGLSKKDFKNRTISLGRNHHLGETTGIPLDQQIQMAKNALKAMSLTDDFGRFVLIVGHGSTTVNNPHATGYDCGACGGHSGEANARVAAAVLNNRVVRTALQSENIFIPVNTIFLACLHDTTTDEVRIFNEYDVPNDRIEELQSLQKSLASAGHAARTERSLRMKSSSSSGIEKMIITRSKDWSQTRPEWGLAGCSAFVVAPRERTKGMDMEGKSFLHSYEWEKDSGFSVLELIMTAPMVVTSWINLQYYGSTVDNKTFGSGNKTLHNVTAGLGVLEGYSGDLRVGLPIQAVHDGEKYQHQPEKLNVIIEAPIEAINSILKKHKAVRDLVDNGWIYLMVMNDGGKISHKYAGDLTWESIAQVAA
ncbi:YbcC family protein [Algoriphagus yeomjeoni]|uniref:YbcC family protein n=1 Tax=Algoriphagus yeomjeoni TaxID=291403 RepID=UPI003CE5405C